MLPQNVYSCHSNRAQEKQDAVQVDEKKSATFSQALKKVDHLTDAISCSVVYTCTRPIKPATVHHLWGHILLQSELSAQQTTANWLRRVNLLS